MKSFLKNHSLLLLFIYLTGAILAFVFLFGFGFYGLVRCNTNEIERVYSPYSTNVYYTLTQENCGALSGYDYQITLHKSLSPLTGQILDSYAYRPSDITFGPQNSITFKLLLESKGETLFKTSFNPTTLKVNHTYKFYRGRQR